MVVCHVGYVSQNIYLSRLLLSPPPQGFGVAAKTTQECRRMDPMSIVVFHQADVGEFIRNEDTLT